MRVSELLRQQGRPLLLDGACGTYYRALTGSDSPSELANLTAPQTVRQIHTDYLAAGAQVLLSNTFMANYQLEPDAQKLTVIIRAGLQLARESAGETAAVLADIGPLTGESEENQSAELCRLLELFLAAGAQDFLFETQGEFDYLRPGLSLLQEKAPDAYILVSFAVSQDGYSNKGHYYKDLLNAAQSQPNVAGIGLNCVCGPGHILRLLAQYPPTDKALLAMPNAGYPTVVNRRIVYEDNEDYFAERVAEMIALGCTFVGGCCGTTPKHIAKIRDIIRKTDNISVKSTAPAHPRSQVPPVISTDQPSFLQKLAAPEAATVVELNPPSADDISHFLAAAKLAAQAGADIISITDSPLARARADSMMLAAKLHRELGLEVLPHLSCRDRNRIGIQATLLAAAMEEIGYVLAVRGDAAAEGVFGLNSRQLISFIQSLNRELLQQHPLQVGGALNLNAPNFAAELRRAQAKAEAGCQYFLTQPLLEEQALENLRLADATLEQPLLAGILPVAGYKNAVYLNNEVGGINIPAPLLSSLEQADPDDVREISLNHCRGMMRQARPYCAGYYLMTPLNRIEWTCTLVEEAKQL